MVKKFRGKVKIADVQNEFDKLVDKINSLNARINQVSTDKENIDWRYGSETLSPINYTLTIGGLKQALNNFDGAVYGARAFKTDNTHFKMTDGLLISKYGAFRLPDSILTIPTSKRLLYYNVLSGEYQWTNAGEGEIEIPIEKTITDKTCLAPSSYHPDCFVYKTETSGYSDYDNINSYTPSVTFLKTKNLEPISGNNLTYDPEYPDRVRLNIGDYKYLAFHRLSLNDKITMQYRGSVVGANNLILGTLTDDAAYFKPKIYLRLWYYAVGGLKMAVEVHGLNTDIALTHQTITDSTTDTNGECIVADDNDTSNIFYVDWPDETPCDAFEFLFEKDSLTNALRLTVNLVNKESGVFSTGFTTITKNVEDFNINCCIFNNKRDGSYQDDYLNYDDETNAHLIDRNLNKVFKYSTSETIYLDSDYRYTEWIKEPVTDGIYKICTISPQRDSLYLNDIQGLQIENIYGTYEVAVQNRVIHPLVNYGSYDRSMAEAVNNSSSPKFVCGLEDDGEAVNANDLHYSACYFKGQLLVSYNYQPYSRTQQAWYPMNYLYLPKGAANPFTYINNKANATKVFNVIINKNIKG